MRWLHYILARFYEVRSERAFASYIAMRDRAEKFFRRAGL